MNAYMNKNDFKTIDPVCGMKTSPHSRYTYNYNQQVLYFCNQSCLEAFRNNPKKYLSAHPKNKKGLWHRYLERLKKATGGKTIKCH